MNKDIVALKQESELALIKAKKLLKKIKKSLIYTASKDWIIKLWKWADKNKISKHIFPRNEKKLLKLTVLDLSDCKLGSIPREIGNLINLKSINLENNRLSSMPIAIRKLIYLNRLNIQNNKLTEIPKDVEKLVNLKWLNLGYNQIEKISMDLSKLSNLTKLILEKNQLTQLPHEIIKLKNLIHLNLVDCFAIKENPLAITYKQKLWLKMLKKNNCTVKMDENLLNHVHTWFEKLYFWADENNIIIKNINTPINEKMFLELSGKHLSTLPKEFAKLVNLDGLYLNNNSFKKFPEGILKLINLKHLELEHNMLTKIPNEIGKLKNLKRLYIKNNCIKELPKEIINLVELEELDIRNNELAELLKKNSSLLKRVFAKLKGDSFIYKQYKIIQQLKENGCNVKI